VQVSINNREETALLSFMLELPITCNVHFCIDECFELTHSRPGMVGFANSGRHSNNSQFYITLEATPFMDRKFMAIGYVVEGWDVLERLRTEPTLYDRPVNQIQIVSCGQLKLPED
jgi:cyclophilin family peptidyl-prolyl cis-trans isomerase